NGRFIAFPKMNLVREEKTDELGKEHTQYMQLADATKHMPGMGPIEQLHNEMNTQMIQNAQQGLADFPNRVDALQQKYPSLDHKQIQLLVASMFDQTQAQTATPHRIRRMTLEQMPLIDEPCMVSVFHMPQTYWSVVMVTPASMFTKPANKASTRFAIGLISLELLALMSILTLIHILIVNPNKRRKIDGTTAQYEKLNNHKIEEDLSSLKTVMNQVRKIVTLQKQDSDKKNHASLASANIHKLITDILNIDKQDMLAHQIQCDVQVTFEDLILLDTHRLGQALTNILANARRALQDVPQDRRNLKISARILEQKILQITITDTGSGITTEHLPHIFKHGYSSKPYARGVGLHSAMQAISELEGVINAFSDGPGKGTIIALEIPVQIQALEPITSL
ncbi:MAG: ATP-binding protein, partial [Phycisphaeraceae bacterium]|nr:ATP-binding protein [Phycisphaeraceae bacterium]